MPPPPYKCGLWPLNSSVTEIAWLCGFGEEKKIIFTIKLDKFWFEVSLLVYFKSQRVWSLFAFCKVNSYTYSDAGIPLWMKMINNFYSSAWKIGTMVNMGNLI